MQTRSDDRDPNSPQVPSVGFNHGAGLQPRVAKRGMFIRRQIALRRHIPSKMLVRLSANLVQGGGAIFANFGGLSCFGRLASNIGVAFLY